AYSVKNTEHPMAQIPMTAELQQRMQNEWGRQLSAFCDDIREIEFDAGYKPEEDDRFVITGFDLPETMEPNRESIDTLEPFRVSEESLRDLSALFAYAALDGVEVIIMQRFT